MTAPGGRFFRVRNWDKYQDTSVRRPHWLKLSLDFFDDPSVLILSDSQRLAFIAVLILSGKRSNVVPFDATYIKKRCSLRTTPDLPAFMAHGLIEEIDSTVEKVLTRERGEREEIEKRGEEKRKKGKPTTPPTDSPERREFVDAYNECLGYRIGYTQGNLAVVDRAIASGYTITEARAVFSAIAAGSTNTAKWCKEKNSDFEYVLRPPSTRGGELKRWAFEPILNELSKVDSGSSEKFYVRKEAEPNA